MKFAKRFIAWFLAAAILMAAVSCFGGEKPVMEISGIEVDSGVYTYHMCFIRASLLATYAQLGGEEEFWDSVVGEDGMTAEEYADGLVRETVEYNLAAAAMFDGLGLQLTADALDDIDDRLESYYEGSGTREAFDKETLAMYGFDSYDLYDTYIMQAKRSALENYLYGENGIEKITDAKLFSYLKDNYARVKLIVVWTDEKFSTDEEGYYVYDSDGNTVTEPLTEAERAEKYEKVAQIEQLLADGADFDTVMEQYSEVDSSKYTNGFFVNGDDYVNFGEKFVIAAREMEVGETITVEDVGRVFIARRYSMLPMAELEEADLEQLDNLEFYCRETTYRARLDEYVAKITTSPQADTFSIRTAVSCSLY